MPSGLQTRAVEMNNSSGISNSHLPIVCSEVRDSASVDEPRSDPYMTSASCSPWQSGFGPGVSRRERGETTVKTAEPADNFSLQSDTAAVQHDRSCERQIPCYVDYSDVGCGAENLINLRTTSLPDDAHHESRLSRDGIGDTTVTDASAETSSQPGYTPASH